MQEFKVTLPWPMKQLSPNFSGHWAVVAKAKAQFRSACRLLSLAAGAKAYGSEWPENERRRVHFDFYPPDRRHRDDANQISAMKAGVDGMADALGIDDKYFRTSYELHEQIGGYVKVTITRNEE